MSPLQDVYDEVMQRLEAANLEPCLYCAAQTGSFYIKFKDERLRSLRIGDHEGRSKYRYKWNIRTDIKFSYEDQRDVPTRFYYMDMDLDRFIKRILRYYAAILRNDEKEAS